MPDNKPKSPFLQKSRNSMKTDATIGLIWLWLFDILCYWTLQRICIRYPKVANVLLIAPEPEAVGERVEMPDGQPAEVLENAPPPVESDAFMALSFFLINLVICVLWYALNYDEAGTVNPAWTDVFG